MDAFTGTPLCPSPIELELEHIAFAQQELIVTTRARRRVVACPVCNHASKRIHSHYRRTLLDLPWHGLRVRLELHVRRFFCDQSGCSRQIFTERLPRTAAPYARRTARAVDALTAIGFAVGGHAGARLAEALGLNASPQTVLAQRGRLPVPATQHPSPRVVGIDDWAWRRGQRYGTILVDLERHRVLDLLPDREQPTVVAWLKAHTGIEIITRDRASAYADAAREGAPTAIQVADRFHLMRNLMEAVEDACRKHHPDLKASSDLTHPKPLPTASTRKRRYSGLPNNQPRPTKHEQRAIDRRARRMARYEQVLALRAQRTPKQRIAELLGLDRRTVATWLAAGHFPERAQKRRRPHHLDQYADYITERYDAGVDNAAALARELRERGYRGNDAMVRRYLANLRRVRPRPLAGAAGAGDARAAAVPPNANNPTETKAGAPSPTAGPAPSPRETAWLLRKAESQPEALRPEEQDYVDALCSTCPALARVQSLATEFARVLKEHDSSALEPWLLAAEQSELRKFAASLRRDHDAVLAAVLFQWSNGQVEGQVQRLKLIKRTMYGRASFELLRRRVVDAA